MTAVAETEAPGRYVILPKGGVVKVGALAGTDVALGLTLAVSFKIENEDEDG